MPGKNQNLKEPVESKRTGWKLYVFRTMPFLWAQFYLQSERFMINPSQSSLALKNLKIKIHFNSAVIGYDIGT